MFGTLDVKAQPQGVIDFDTERYFLPLNDLMGIEGRWPGPFGHNGDTAMMGALILIIGIAFRSRSSWVFIAVGGATLLLTNGRASMGATIAGLVILIMFTNHGFFARFSRRIRLMGGSILLVLGALVMYLRPAGLTGRERIWPAFLDLWFSSPLFGVGNRGIANGDEVTSLFLHAHSLYIDELARYGLAGFLSQFGALAIGVGIAAVVAWRGYPAPLAVLAAYLVTGITEPRNTWIAPTATGFLVILMVVAASAKLRDSTDETEHLGEEPALAFNGDRQDQQGARERTD
jgi:O-antigen ligase